MASGSARSVTELLGDVETTMDEASSVRLGSELFGVIAVLDAQPTLREALSDPGVTVEGKRSLLDDGLGRKVGKVTKDLLTQVVVGRHGPPTRGIAYYLRVLSVRHERLQATAWVATDLNADQRTR